MCPRVSVHSPHTATISVHFIEVFISLLQVTQANSAWPCLHAVVDGGVDCECGAWEKWVDRETIGCGGDTQANSAWPSLHAVVDGGVDCECGAWENWVDRETIGCGGDVDVSTSAVEWCTVGGFSSVCLLPTTTTTTTTTTQHIKWFKKQQAGTLRQSEGVRHRVGSVWGGVSPPRCGRVWFFILKWWVFVHSEWYFMS